MRRAGRRPAGPHARHRGSRAVGAAGRGRRRPGQDRDEAGIDSLNVAAAAAVACYCGLAYRLVLAGATGESPASPRGSGRPARSCRAYSFLRARPDSRSPKTVPFRWSVSCCRQRASNPVPTISTGLPTRPARDRSRGPGRASSVRAGQREAALVRGLELAVLALGQDHLGIADHADVAHLVVVGAVEDENGQVHARPGSPRARRPRRRTSSRTCPGTARAGRRRTR